MNGLSIFQIKAHSRYGIEEFNEDLRSVMRRVGVDGEKVCFIFDEGNVLGSGFIEAMNALLASGEVPGLFEGDEYNALMSAVVRVLLVMASSLIVKTNCGEGSQVSCSETCTSSSR